MLLQCCQSRDRSIQNHCSVCSIKHASIYSSRNFNNSGSFVFYLLAFFCNFHIFCWNTWAKIRLWVHYWGKVEQNDALRFYLLNVCTFLGQLIYYRMCPVYNWSISLHLVLRMQHGYKGTRYTWSSIRLVSQIPLRVNRIWFFYHRCLPNDSVGVWILSIENGSR